MRMVALAAERHGAELDLACSAASMRTGALLDDVPEPAQRAELEGLAATLPELYGTVDPRWLQRISERLEGDHRGSQELSEILLLSEQRLHVIAPLARRPGVALLAVSSAVGKIGLVLSAVHARAAALEEE